MAAAAASRRLQSLSQTPSLVSAVLVTVNTAAKETGAPKTSKKAGKIRMLNNFAAFSYLSKNGRRPYKGPEKPKRGLIPQL
jgi:hypothetical protein